MVRRWSAYICALACSGAAASADAAPVQRPLASRFDLSSYMARTMIDDEPMRADDGLQHHWMLPDIAAAPPAPAHHEPHLRIRGKKVKLRLPF